MGVKKHGMLHLLNDLQDLYMYNHDDLMYNYHAGTLYSLLDYASDYDEKLLNHMVDIFMQLDQYIIEDYDFVEVIPNKYYNIDKLEYCIKINGNNVELVLDLEEDRKYRARRSGMQWFIVFLLILVFCVVITFGMCYFIFGGL